MTGTCEQSLVSFVPLTIRVISRFARNVLLDVDCPTRAGRSAATGACEKSLVSFFSLAIRVMPRFARNLPRRTQAVVVKTCTAILLNSMM